MHPAANDDFDPLAPVYYGETDDDVPIDEHGWFRDPERVVQLRFDGDELVRVRIAFGWSDRIGHKPLESYVNAALALARSRVASAHDEADTSELPDISDVDFSGITRFNADVFATFKQAFENFQQQWDQAVVDAVATDPDGSGPVWGKTQYVAVLTDDHGWPERVEFDDEWLEDAERGEIADAVIEAARRARAAFRPASSPNDHLDALVRQHTVLMRGMLTSLTGEDQR